MPTLKLSVLATTLRMGKGSNVGERCSNVAQNLRNTSFLLHELQRTQVTVALELKFRPTNIQGSKPAMNSRKLPHTYARVIR